MSVRNLVFGLVFSAIYALFFVYPPLRIGFLLEPNWQPGFLTIALLSTSPALARLSYELLPRPTTRWLSAAGFTWAGCCFIGFILLVPVELLNIAFDVANQTTARYILAATMALSFLGFANAQRLETETLALTLPSDAPGAAKGLTFAQVSDVHIGSRGPGLLKRMVKKVNALNVDRVFITGDLVDFANISKASLAPLANFNAPVDFCIGNHERYVDLEPICQRLTDLGINVLRNRSSTHNVKGVPLQLIGIDDAERRNQVYLELAHHQPAAEHYRILLYHRPDNAEAAANWGAHLMLCGHTHNGQIVPFNFLVRRVFPRIRGRYQIGNMTLYVSSGTGTWGPVLRLGSCGEITQIRLV